jgi:hypothetical protein
MIKKVTSVVTAPAPATTGASKSLTLTTRAQARLEAAAAAFHAEAASERGLIAVSRDEGISAVIKHEKHGKTLIEISGDDFAVRRTD